MNKLKIMLLIGLLVTTNYAFSQNIQQARVPKKVIQKNDLIRINDFDTVKISFPEFPLMSEPDNDKIRKILTDYSHPLMLDFIELCYKYDHERGFFQNWSYDIVYQSQDILSLKLRYDEYTGGAHANTFFKTFNIDLNTFQNVEIEHYYPNIDYKKIEKYCANEHKKMAKEFWTTDSSHYKNTFKNWNYTKSGLLLSFAPYQVGPYSQGISQVLIPNEELEKMQIK